MSKLDFDSPVSFEDTSNAFAHLSNSDLRFNYWIFRLMNNAGLTNLSTSLAEFAIKLKNEGHFVVADFICPTPEARSLFPSDYLIWVDTIKEGRFDDTNKMFIKPEKYDFHVTTQDAKNWAPKIFKEIK